MPRAFPAPSWWAGCPCRAVGRTRLAAALEAGDILIGEPLSRKGGLAIGDSLHLVGPRGPVAFRIAGVVYDYTSEGGTGFLTMDTLLRNFPDELTNNAALFLRDGVDTADLRDRLRERYRDRPLVFRSNRDLRREVLAIFDQTFAVTRTLQWLALLIAVLGVALNLVVQSRERSGELAPAAQPGRRPAPGLPAFFWAKAWPWACSD